MTCSTPSGSCKSNSASCSLNKLKKRGQKRLRGQLKSLQYSRMLCWAFVTLPLIVLLQYVSSETSETSDQCFIIIKLCYCVLWRFDLETTQSLFLLSTSIMGLEQEVFFMLIFRAQVKYITRTIHEFCCNIFSPDNRYSDSCFIIVTLCYCDGLSIWVVVEW